MSRGPVLLVLAIITNWFNPLLQLLKNTCSRHIRLFLLLVFTSSLWGEGVLAAHNIYQLSAKSSDQVVSSSACLDGFAISGGMNVSIATDATSRLFQRIDFEDDPEQEERKMIVSNCSTSLQILPVNAPALTVHQASSLISSSILLLSPQLFVHQLADPPRIG